MQWGEIWTPGVHDTVVGGVILAVIVGALGLAWAWVRNWRMQNPWVWLVSNLKEDMRLNLGAFICSLVLVASMAVLVSSDLSKQALYTSLAVGVVSYLLFGWFSYFVDSTAAGSSKPLFYRHKATPSVVSSVASAKAESEHAPALVAGPTSVSASDLKRSIKQVQAGDLDKYLNREGVEFNVIKALYQTQGQPGLTVKTICLMRELRTVDVQIALNELGTAGVIEQRDEQFEPTYRLTEAGLTLFRRWMRTPNRG